MHSIWTKDAGKTNYDWQTRIDRQGGGQTTLYSLRMICNRDYQAIIAVNMAGTTEGHGNWEISA